MVRRAVYTPMQIGAGHSIGAVERRVARAECKSGRCAQLTTVATALDKEQGDCGDEQQRQTGGDECKRQAQRRRLDALVALPEAQNCALHLENVELLEDAFEAVVRLINQLNDRVHVHDLLVGRDEVHEHVRVALVYLACVFVHVCQDVVHIDLGARHIAQHVTKAALNEAHRLWLAEQRKLYALIAAQ